MIIGSFAVVFVHFFVIIIATLARAPIAARIAGSSEEIPVVSTRLSVGGADGETEELFARTYRERAWVVGLAIIPPLLVLLARVVAVGALGTPADLPAGADWG